MIHNNIKLEDIDKKFLAYQENRRKMNSNKYNKISLITIIISTVILIILIDYSKFVNGFLNKNINFNTTLNEKTAINKNKNTTTLLIDKNLIKNNQSLIISTFNQKHKNENNSVQFGDDSSASIFKPSFFKGLLGVGDKRKPSNQNQPEEEEEEEEVTKTIVMPIKEPTETIGGNDNMKTETTNLYSNKNQLMGISKNIQPKPEASLQLTSTEMNSILNDGEAPEFYRERELNGDGVLVGEERNRLWTSASDRFNGNPNGFGTNFNGLQQSNLVTEEAYLNGNSLNDGDSMMNQQRLAHAASEAGFNHRFGATFNGGDDLSSYNLNSGRLMQSPNEYSEFNSNSEYNSGLSGGGSYSSNGIGGPIDYSNSNSGLLRAGSEFGGVESGFAGGSYRGGYSGGSSYSNSPILDRHASELYSPSGGGGLVGIGDGINSNHFPSTNNDLNSIYNSRLVSAGSHNPNHETIINGGNGFNNFNSAPDEYSSRFGHSGPSMPFDQRGFATQNNIMLRGNSIVSNSMKRNPDENSISKLVPLSPHVPIADDLISSNQGSYREASNNIEKEATKVESYNNNNNNNIRIQKQQPQQQQVHESLDDDASEPGDDSEDNSSSSNYNSNGGMNESDDESPTRATTVRTSRGEAASLVLNVPPPNIDNSIGSKATIDFTRIGSAGYLAPSLSENDDGYDGGIGRGKMSNVKQRFVKKEGRFIQSIMNNNQRQSQTNYDPSENPAHAGKYIID